MASRGAQFQPWVPVATVVALATASLAGGGPWLVIPLALVGVLFVVPVRRMRGESTAEPMRRLARLTGASAEAEGPLADLVERAEAMLEEARRGEIAAAAEAATLRAILAGLDEAMVSIAESGRIDVCNPAAAAMLGTRAERLVGRTPVEAFTQAEVHAACERAARGERVRSRIRVGLGDAERVLEVSAGPATPEGRVVIAFRDTTELSRALQMKTDFVANASHELRTPLAAVRLALETLEDLGDESPQTRARLVGTISRNVHRLEQMIRDLMDLSRLESPESEVRSEPVSMADVSEELGGLFGPACEGRRVRLRFEVEPEAATLRTDRSLLTLILSNLIDNAISFAIEGTDVRVVGRASEHEPGTAIFEVIDRGQGIPVHLQQRIFERYYQVDAARDGGVRRGTGLGLAIVKHAVRRLGGSVRVNSVWGQGTTMIVELPGALGDPGGVSPGGVPPQRP
ncbi:MAG: PAS domain-containing protein [Phycisphaerae bacterium]|nr:PAS domain-containing protein [Phycisphaerae bacterium]